MSKLKRMKNSHNPNKNKNKAAHKRLVLKHRPKKNNRRK